MTKADAWTNPLRGYRYDSFNHDVLTKARVENGMIVTEGGTKYGALVIPQARPMNPDHIVTCWNVIDSLEAKGARVIREPWTQSDLSSIGIKRDITLPEGIDYVHRHADDADIYFMSNQTDKTISFVPEFRAGRANKYIADPMTGKVYNTQNQLTLTAGASLFVVLTDQNIDAEDMPDMNKYDTAISLDGNKWTVKFEKTGKQVTTEKLFDWSKADDQSVKFYSGHATYETTFKYKGKPEGRVFIDLGEVADIATVYVNGNMCGTAWMPPYNVDITQAVKKGKNELKIVVVNTWANALQGNDQGTPPFEGIWTNGKYRRASKELLPAGLLGPVVIKN